MKITTKQKRIIYGLILGDGYIQRTGRKNARLRLEHSAKQEEYIKWKYAAMQNLFEKSPRHLSRIHPDTKNTSHYYRLQSHSSPFFGKLQQEFYENGKKRIPESIKTFLNTGLTLAVWYMDDGHYYQRDNSAHVYLPKISAIEQKRLRECLRTNFDLDGKIYCRPDRKACQINFTGKNKEKFFTIISPYIIPSLRYKLPNPVSTESENQ